MKTLYYRDHGDRPYKVTTIVVSGPRKNTLITLADKSKGWNYTAAVI